MADIDKGFRPDSITEQPVTRKEALWPPIRLALYPFVPRRRQFQRVITRHWQRKYPGSELIFEEFNCYKTPTPPANLEVFAFDNLFGPGYIQRRLLRPWNRNDIQAIQDFHPVLLNACSFQNVLYAVPHIACHHVLLMRKNDHALHNAVGLNGIFQVLGPCSNPTQIWPAPGAGLLASYSSNSSTALLFLIAVNMLRNQYPDLLPLPLHEGGLDPEALSALRKITEMAGVGQVNYTDPDKERILHFGQGTGRCLLGFTELLSFLSHNQLGNVTVRLWPYGSGASRTQVYLDCLGINALVTDPARIQLLTELVNLIASAQVWMECNAPVPEENEMNPQYLIPVRPSVLQQLASQDVLYQQIAAMQASIVNVLRFDVHGYDWLTGALPAIIRQRVAGNQSLEDQIRLLTRSHDPSLPANILERWG